MKNEASGSFEGIQERLLSYKGIEGATGTIVLKGYLYLDSWSLSGEGVIQF